MDTVGRVYQVVAAKVNVNVVPLRVDSEEVLPDIWLRKDVPANPTHDPGVRKLRG